MVFLSDRSTAALLAATGGRWRASRWASPRWPGPRWMVLPVALPLFLFAGLAAGTLVNLGFSGIGLGDGDGGLLAPASAATADAGAPAGACERMAYIVSTACALQQRDHDVEGARQCVAQELKYTLWSAYGCR